MRTLYIRHMPDEVTARLETLAAQAGLPLSTFALRELTESARRADNAELVDALQALAAANRLGLRRHPSRSLWPRAWELRSNLTADARLARAPGLRCVVELAEA